ncbi:MAG TPA: hypothetical protein DEP72_01130 [Clostridiales bacterium]|nr:hypothetical protein [Clostridiales bacterium]
MLQEKRIEEDNMIKEEQKAQKINKEDEEENEKKTYEIQQKIILEVINREESRQEELIKEELKQKELRQEELRQEELRQEEAKKIEPNVKHNLMNMLSRLKPPNEVRQEEVRLEEARLEEARLEEARLEEVRLEEVRQEEVRLEEARLEEARLEEIRQEEVRLEEARLEEARLEEIRQEEVRLEEARLEEIRREEVRLEEARLEEVRLEEIRREEVRLEEVRLEEARLEEARLEEARLEEARLEEARIEEIRLEEVRLEEVRLEEIRLEEIRLEEIRLEEIRLEEIRLEEVRLEEIRQEEARQEEARLEEKVPEEIKLEDEKKSEEVPKDEILNEDYKRQVREKTKSILEQISFEEIDYDLNKDFSSHKIILLLSPEKTGKTTIAVNLAEEIASRGIKTTLIDTDTIRQDAYYYFNTEEKGCLSKLSSVKILSDVYDLGLEVNKNLKLFSEHKGVDVHVSTDDIIKLVKISAKHSEIIIVDCANFLDSNIVNKLIEMASGIFIVTNKQVNMASRLPIKLYDQRRVLQNKKVDLIINMDEEIDYFKKSVVVNFFKNITSPLYPMEKYTIPINEVFSIAYDLKSIIIGLTAPRQSAIKVKGNKIHAGIKQLAEHVINRK